MELMVQTRPMGNKQARAQAEIRDIARRSLEDDLQKVSGGWEVNYSDCLNIKIVEV